jgi:hypothetical protein
MNTAMSLKCDESKIKDGISIEQRERKRLVVREQERGMEKKGMT